MGFFVAEDEAGAEHEDAEGDAVDEDWFQQEEDWDLVRKNGLATGASKVVISDLQKEYVEDYIFPAFRAGAIWGNWRRAWNKRQAWRPGREGSP